MTVNDYIGKYGGDALALTQLHQYSMRRCGFVCGAAIEFTPVDASRLAQPFHGNCAYVDIVDHRKEHFYVRHPFPTEAALRLAHRLSHDNMPWRKYSTPARSEGHLQTRLKSLTLKQRKDWQAAVTNYAITVPTAERPVRLCVHGNDDASWSAFFADVPAAEVFLEEMRTLQPVEFAGLSQKLVFTN